MTACIANKSPSCGSPSTSPFWGSCQSGYTATSTCLEALDTTNVTQSYLGTCFWCPSSTKFVVTSTASSTPPLTTTSVSPTTLPSTSNPSQPTTTQASNSFVAPDAQATGGTKLNHGAVAGIGVGSALAGALLAGLIVFVLFRRKRQQSSYPQQHLPFNGAGYMGQEKYGVVATTREIRGATATNIDRLLPQPAEDDAIVGGLSKIRDGIKNHVQNYYHTGLISHEMVDEPRLLDLSQATGIPASTLLKFLFNPATRLPTIRLFLGHMILSRCQGRRDGQPSFLPSEVSGLAAYQSSINANSCKSGLLTVSCSN